MRFIAFILLAALAIGPAALAQTKRTPVKAAATKPAATKPTPAKPAAKPVPAAAPKPASFNARDPASLVALLGEMGAKGEISGSEDDSVFIRVTTPTYGFSVQFAGCDKTRRACKAVLFSAPATKGSATLMQLNRFNQTAIACRGYQDQAGQLRALYDALLFDRDGREEMTGHLGAWQGCLAAFGEFLDDPNGYLASAP